MAGAGAGFCQVSMEQQRFAFVSDRVPNNGNCNYNYVLCTGDRNESHGDYKD